MAFGLSSCYDVKFFVNLLGYFICIKAIHTSKADSIIVFNVSKNQSHKYYNYYIIKFIGFMSIFYVINLDIISSYTVFSDLYRSLTSLNQ